MIYRAPLVTTANKIAAVRDVVYQAPHEISFVSSSTATSSSTRPRVSIGVKVEVRTRAGARARARARARSDKEGPIKLQPGLCSVNSSLY